MSLRLSRWLPRLRLAALAGAAVAALTACGGEVSDPFKPQRILSVGDEYSYIDATSGAKYTINGLTSDSKFDCSVYPLWNQWVAREYGFTFQECKGADGRARALAKEGAKVADVGVQADVAGGVQDKDLVLLQVGANDVWQLYQDLIAGGDLAALKNEATRRGDALGQLVKNWNDKGARVVVMDVFNQGQTPEAGAAAATNPTARTQLQELSTAFNDGLRAVLSGNQRKTVLVLGNNRLSKAVEDKDLKHRDTNACLDSVATAKACSTATLNAGVDPNPRTLDYIFAKDRYLTPAMNQALGEQAVKETDQHPF
ncbi:hypothetical protein [Eleftheria terrae]|uniref:hypothetical protein n=1 Tax=Eleftheria terrae TaxID=1597781 RepID=UPI00263BC393|nr:hypothetical protein [Eleftheria terrae]WKB51899.1 hypothetical protein N7L95_19135 [Eleftheria terrae]